MQSEPGGGTRFWEGPAEDFEPTSQSFGGQLSGALRSFSEEGQKIGEDETKLCRVLSCLPRNECHRQAPLITVL